MTNRPKALPPSAREVTVVPPLPDPRVVAAKKLREQALFLPPEARRGTFVSGSSGSGKTLLMARMIGWFDFWNQVPMVLFDPHGALIDYFLDKYWRQPLKFCEQHAHRLKYIDMSGRRFGRVVPMPLYYRMGAWDTLEDIATRPLALFFKLDPYLQQAPLMGWNSLKETGKDIGMICAALGWQITEAEKLLLNPGAFSDLLEQARDHHPELYLPIVRLYQLAETKGTARERQLTTFLSKARDFTRSQHTRALYGADQPGINWQEVIEQKQVVMFDFRHIETYEQKSFAMQFALNYLLDFIKSRGAGRHEPISLIVDELTALFPMVGQQNDQLAKDVDALINQYARNYRMWLTISTQELYQFGENNLFRTLLSMPIQLHGVTSNPLSARLLEDRFFHFDPDWERLYKPHYVVFSNRLYQWLEKTFDEPVFYTVEEQKEMRMQGFMKLKQGQFFFNVPSEEGGLIGRQGIMSIKQFDRGRFPQEQAITAIQEHLMKLHGQTVSQINRQIDARTADYLYQPELANEAISPEDTNIYAEENPGYNTVTEEELAAILQPIDWEKYYG